MTYIVKQLEGILKIIKKSPPVSKNDLTLINCINKGMLGWKISSHEFQIHLFVCKISSQAQECNLSKLGT